MDNESDSLVGLVSVVQGAVAATRALIEERRHELRVELPDEALVVRADPVRLERVFADMIGAAARNTPPGGRLELRATREESWVQVAISEQAGTGANGQVRVFGNVGLSTSLRDRDLVGPDAPLAPLRSTLRVLIVEDDSDTANSFGRLLEALGNDVRIVHNGPDALVAGQEFLPDVVLLDIGLPFMNGFEVARKLRERFWGRDAVLIATTAWEQDEDRRQSKQAGIDHHLAKPVDPIELARLLRASASSR